MKELNLELGQWVITSVGYGQIMYIRENYVEDYETNRLDRKNGEFINYFYIFKILCGFDGKIKKSNRINVDTSINPIDKKGLKFVEKIKLEQKEEYKKYLLYDEKNITTNQKFLYFYLHDLNYNEELVLENFYNILSKLQPSFTYKEFSKEFQNYDFPFKLENLNRIDTMTNLSGHTILLRFDSILYRKKGKEAIFDNVRMFFPEINEK